MILREFSVNRNTAINFVLILMALWFAGCSSQQQISKTSINKSETAERVYPPEAVDHVILASIYETQGDYVMAIHQYNQAILYDSTSMTLYESVAENYQRLGEYNSARLVLEKAINKIGNERELLRHLGEIQYDSRLLDQALATFIKLTELYPDDIDGWKNLGTLYIQTGNNLKAIEAYNQVLSLDGPDFDLLVRQATLYSLSDDLKGALDTYGKMFEINPNDHQIPFSMGGILLEMGDSTYADSMFELSASLAPEISRYWMIRIQLAAVRKDTLKSLEIIDQALQKNPEDIEILGLAGSLLFNYKMHEDAEKLMLKAAELDTVGVLHLVNLGFLYHEMKQWDKAEESYKKAMEKEPNDAQLMNNYAYMLAEKGERFEEALEYVNLAIDLEPGYASFLDTKGWLLYLLDDYEQALIFMEKAIGLDNTNPEILDHMGDIYKAIGEIDRAQEMWTKALENGGDQSRIGSKLE